MATPRIQPVDAVAFGPHPDDVEIFCGGTVARLVRLGHPTVIVDLTAGELSSRGTVETRQAEAEAAARVLGVEQRINLGLPDGGLANSPEQRLALITVIRRLRPRLLLLPHTEDRHPDHEEASILIRTAAFQAGLAKIDTGQPPHRTEGQMNYMCHHPFTPSLVVDISDDQETKERAIACYRTQFATEVLGGEAMTGGPQTPISTPRFMEQLLARSRYFGSLAGVTHGEPFLTRRPPLVSDPLDLLPGKEPREETAK